MLIKISYLIRYYIIKKKFLIKMRRVLMTNMKLLLKAQLLKRENIIHFLNKLGLFDKSFKNLSQNEKITL